MAREATIEEIDGGADDEAPGETHQDVARKVDTQIEARPTVGKRPDDEGETEGPTTHQPTEEDGDAERIAGMGGEETVLAATIAIDDINEGANDWIMGGTPTAYEGFDDEVVNRTGKEDAESCTAHDQTNALQAVMILHHQIEQAEIERQPGDGGGKHMNH